MLPSQVIGGGIVGLATACELLRRKPGIKLILIEKEESVAKHQTGHNSGVIHAGVYYTPNSLKADFCKRGAIATMDFCRQQQIPFRQPGKLLVACSALEVSRMYNLLERCRDKDIAVEVLTQQQLRQREPNIRGLAALHVPETGIVDYRLVCLALAKELQRLGGKLLLNSCVENITEEQQQITVQCENAVFKSKFLISCAGLMADRLCKMQKLDIDFRIIPFRGEYFQLPENRQQLVKHLIYPIPDPELPFLGIHLTPMMSGAVTIGPNALLGLKREAYGRINFNWRDVKDMVSYGGFWRMLLHNLRPGLFELKNSLFKRAYLNQARKYCPQLTHRDLNNYPAGIRAQAVSNEGKLIPDFLFKETPRSLYVCNAPSPAATSALPIAEYICDKLPY